MKNLFTRRGNKYNQTEATNFTLNNLIIHHKKSSKTISMDNKTIKNFNYYLFKYNEMTRKVPLRQYLFSNENNLLVKNFKKPNSKNLKNNVLRNNEYSKNNKKSSRIFLKSENGKKKFILISPLKKENFFLKAENIGAISEKLISKKIHSRVPSNFLFKKNKCLFNYNTENDMKPKIMFKNIKKELNEETLKINKMFVELNKEISDKELSIRAIINKLSHTRKKKSDNYCDLLHL